MQLVICRSGGFTGTVTLLFQLVISHRLVRVGVKIPQDGNRTIGPGTWQWCIGMFGARFAVFVRRARVLPGPCPATRNLS